MGEYHLSRHKIWIAKKPETTMDWLFIIFSGIAFYVVLSNLGFLWEKMDVFLGVLTPFAGGIAIAYILDPIVRNCQKYLMRNNPRLRLVSILIAYIVAVVVVGALAWMLIPQLMDSVKTLFNNFSGYVQNAEQTLMTLQARLGVEFVHASELLDAYENMMSQLYEMLKGWIPQIMGYVGSALSNFVAVFTAITASVYMLADKERLLHQLRTMTHAFLPPRAAERTLSVCRFANENFTGFIVGKIIDSTIIGILCFISMNLLRLDFPLLISVVVGVTNIIPVFGPFIGAIPGVIILLFIEPVQALIFVVLILIIQQLDGNVIGPKILGDSIGISALWILFSIVIGGDLFGFVGMVVGVPLFATCYGLLGEFTRHCLKARGIDANGDPLPEQPAQPE